jgi:alginate O-acetyltransferase complex protein AlgI
VWALTGLWHGGAWTFVIWGLFYAGLLMMEKMWLLKHLQKTNVTSKVLGHIYVLIAVLIGFVIFNAKDMAEALQYLGAMFGIASRTAMLPLVSAEAIYYLKSYTVIFVLAIVGATPVAKNACTWLEEKLPTRIFVVLEFVSLLALVIAATAFLVDGSFNPFLYFRF